MAALSHKTRDRDRQMPGRTDGSATVCFEKNAPRERKASLMHQSPTGLNNNTARREET